MGSTGSGSFSDYPGKPKPKNGGGKGQGGGGAGSGDRCANAFSTPLEDVEHCDFFKKHGGGPAVGTTLHVARKKRVGAQTASGEVVGHLPIKFNYLAGCLTAGYSYVGTVRVSNNGPPIAIVEADFAAVPPK